MGSLVLVGKHPGNPDSSETMALGEWPTDPNPSLSDAAPPTATSTSTTLKRTKTRSPRGSRPTKEAVSSNDRLRSIGEAPEERSQRGRRHHLVAQDPLRRTRPQHNAVVDALGAGDNGMNQREDLAPGNSVSWNVTEVDHLIGQVEGPEPVRQRGDQGQPRTGHRPVIVEGHCKTSRTMRFCVHRKDAFLFWLDVDFSESHLPSTGGIFREWSPVRSSDHTGQFGGSRLNAMRTASPSQGRAHRKRSPASTAGGRTDTQHPTQQHRLVVSRSGAPRRTVGGLNRLHLQQWDKGGPEAI